MNEKAFEDAYNLFVRNGYADGRSDFKKLLSENPQALNDSYKLFQQNGYSDGIDDYKALLGVGVEEPSTWDNVVTYAKSLFSSDEDVKKKADSTVSSSAGSSSASPSNLNNKITTTTQDTANQKTGSHFDNILSNINASLIDEDEDVIAKRLQEKLTPYGVKVDQARIGREAISLTIGEGKNAKTLEVPVDNFLTSNDEASASQIKNWLSQNVDQGVIQQQEEANKFQKTLTSQEDFNTSMKMINPNFIDNDKDYVVPELKGMFGDYGFKFEEAGFGYDAIKVTAPNGKTLNLSIDRFTDKGDLESSNELKAFIEANKPKIDNKVTEYDQYYKRYRNQQEVDEAFKNISQETSSLIEEQKQLAIDVAKLKIEREKLASNPNPERAALLQQKQDEIAQRSSSIMEKESQNQMNEAKLREAVGKFDRYKEEEGTWYKITRNTLLNGLMQGEYAFSDLGFYAMQKLMPDEMLYGKNADKMTEEEKDKAWQESIGTIYEGGKKTVKGWTNLGVSKQYKAKAEENFAARNALGVVGFIPALASSMVNPYAGYAAFFAGGYDGAMEEMNSNPAFKDVSRDEKVGMATALGFVNAAIMKYNVTNTVLESSAGKTIVANVLKRMGSEASAKTVQEFAENEVKSALGRGLLTAGASVPHGFGMGVEMKLSGDAVKKIYNEVKENSSYSINGDQMSESDFKNAVSKMSSEQLKSSVIEAQNPSGNIADLLKQKAKDAKIEGSGASMIKKTEMFQFPETTGEYLKQVAESGLDMAVGSLMMSSINSIGTAYRDNNFNRVDDATIENYKTLSAPEILNAYEQNLNIKVADGQMTEANKNQAMDDARMGISVLNKMPDNLNAAQKRKAFSLIREREILEQRIDGKDKSLVKGETQRITEINKELEDVSKMPRAEAPAAPEAQPAKPKTLDEIQDEEVKNVLSFQKRDLEENLRLAEKYDEKEKIKNIKDKLEILNNNPEQHLNDEIKKYEKIKEEEGGDFKYQDYLDQLTKAQSKLQEENAIQKSKSEEAQPAKPEEEVTTNKQINRGDLKISVDGTTQGLGNIISENYSEKEDGPIKDKRFSVNTRNTIKVESTVKDNGNTELNVVVYHPDNFGRDGAVQFKIEIPKGVEVNSQEIENIVKEKTKQVKLDPQKDAINYKKGVESYLNDIVDNIIKPKENAIQKPTTEESVLRSEQSQMGLPTMGEGNAQETTTQEGVAPAKPEEVKPTEEKPHEQQLAELEQMFPEEKTGENKGVAASDNKAMDEMLSRTKDERVQKVIKTAQRLTKTLRSLFPTADIHIHENEESYNGAMEETNGEKSSNGNFNFGVDANGKPFVRIDINGSKASSKDVAHEVGHAILQKAFGDNQKLFQSFQERIAKVLSNEKNKALLDFINNPKYKEKGVTYEEYMAELKAVLSEQGEKIELSTAKKIAAVINEFVSKITNGKFKPFQEVTDVKQVVDFVNKVTEAMAKGEAIDVEEAGKMGEGSRSSIRVFHGTPHDFDKFTTEKMGTGEGVQAFGWGLYFTDLKGIAEAYAKKLTPKGLQIIDVEKYNYLQDMFPNLEFAQSPKDIINTIDMSISMAEMERGNFEDNIDISNYDIMNRYKVESFENDLEKNKRLDYFLNRLSQSKSPFQKELYETTKNLLNSNKNDAEKTKEFNNVVDKYTDTVNAILKQAINDPYSIVNKKTKNVYDVTLHEGKTPDQYTYLEWDKPISDANRDKINKQFEKEDLPKKINSPANETMRLLGKESNFKTYRPNPISGDGSIFYENLVKYFLDKGEKNPPKEASLFLLRAGIDGIKFPAESIARGATSDTARGFNYVVFDENATTINSVSRSSLRTAEQVDKMVKDARASGYSEKAIEEFLQKRGVDQSIIDKSLGKKEAGKKIVTNEEMMPGYDKMMEDVNSEILRGLDRKTNETTIKKNVMKIVEGSEAYKNATDQQKEQMIRDVEQAFGEKMKESPSAEKITGQQKADTKALNDQIKLEAKAAKEGASSVKSAVKKIRDLIVNNKEVVNLTRKDLLKVIDIMKSVSDEKSLEKATTKVLDMIGKANKDIIEVSKTKIDKQRMKAEIKAAKDSAKGVVNKIKAVKAYFDSVQDYGNLTRKDLRKIMKEMASVKDEKSLDKAVNNINDIIDNAKSDKIEISEKKMIANTIREVKLAKGNIKEKRKMIADVIDEIKKSGKLSANQVNALLKRANKLNVENFEHLNKFIEYTEKLFADAEYDNKLSKGSGLRYDINKLSKNKGNKYNASLVALAERFLSIKPSMVDDIDQYNKMASDLKDAVKGSSAKGFKSTVDIKAVDSYVDEMMTSQKEKLTESMREQVNELLGVDGSTLTYEEMEKMLEKKKEDMSDEEEKIIRSAAIKLFDTLSSTINHILETGKDPFTGEDVDIKPSKKDVIKRFMEMDLTKMDIKDAIAAVDSLNNFIVNESTAKMEKVLSKYNAKRNMEMLIKNKITSYVLKIFRSGAIGRGLLKQLGSETILMDALFKGTGRASVVAKAMGLSDYKSNVSKAKAVVRNMVADYVVEFYKKEANGEAFNTSFNNIERGMLAFVSRLRIGKEEATFKDRKSLVEQSIEALRNGDEKEVEKADLYQKVYDKILKDSEKLDDVKSKVDETNAKAVDFWIEKWAENYEELADVSENIHNVILGKFGNYTPDVVRRVKEYVDNKISEEDMLDLEGSAFLHNSGIVQKKSGRLEKTTVEDKLPEGSYYDFGFDSNNASLMSDALIDAKTAGNVIELSTFLNSPEFNKIVTTSKERKVLKSAISGYVRTVRGKEKYNYDEVSSLVKSFNRASALGASYVLGGIGAIPKQYLVPAVNTMIASGGYRPHFDIWWNKAKQDFVNNSGESVAIRGVMSNADIKNIDNLLEEAATSTPEIALRKIEQVNKIYLKHFLVNRDVAIAKASWLTYYEKGLRKQGFNSKNIDYSKHDLNKEAAQYATRMVDRQQNISDEDFRGRFYSNKEGFGPIVTKVLLPFASFRINQWLRMNTDLGILTNKTTTYEDRLEAAKSLAATGTEIAFFNFVGMGISAGLHSLAISAKRAITGSTDDEEDKKKQKEMDDKYWNNLKKSKGTSLVQDFTSPLPVTDPVFEIIAYNLLDKLQSDKKEEDRINIYDPKPTEVQTWLDYAAAHSGGAGILLDRVSKFKEIASAYLTNKIETTAYGETTEKNIRDKHQKTLGTLTTLAFLNTLGIFPTEVYNAQNTAFKEIKKEASTKTEAEIIQDKAKKREQRADNVQKIQIINEAINNATDQDVVNELMKMKRETRMKLFPEKMSDEAKEVLKKKEEREKAKYKNLLEGYDNKEDLERYDPDLYEQNFGEGSEYYETHKAEVDAKSLLRKTKKKYKDEMYGYEEPPKKKGSKKEKNSDGSYKSSYFRYSSN